MPHRCYTQANPYSANTTSNTTTTASKVTTTGKSGPTFENLRDMILEPPKRVLRPLGAVFQNPKKGF